MRLVFLQNYSYKKKRLHGEISTVNGEHFIADVIISSTRKVGRGDKKNHSNEEKLTLGELVEKYKNYF